MNWPIYKIVFGLRHSRNFAFSGISGSIIDKIVKDKSYYTNPDHAFKEIAWTNDRMGIKLKNKTGNLFLDCNIDGYVLTYHFFEDDDTKTIDLMHLYTKLLKNILSDYEIKKEINRIGIINFFTFQRDDNSAKFLFDNLLSLDLEGMPDQFGLRFALKNVTDSSLVDTTKNDYLNVIYQISSDKIDKEESKVPELIDINIDYQIYFSPERRFESRLIEKHFDEMNDYLQSTNKMNFLGDTHESQ